MIYSKRKIVRDNRAGGAREIRALVEPHVALPPRTSKVPTTPRQLEKLGIASKWFEDNKPTGKSPIIEEAGHKPIP